LRCAAGPSTVFYSEANHFRVVLPANAVRNHDTLRLRIHERVGFEIKAPDGSVLRGLIAADGNNERRCPRTLRLRLLPGLKNATVTLKVIRQDWYALSARRATASSSKGLSGNAHRSIRLDNPAKAKQYFNPLVAASQTRSSVRYRGRCRSWRRRRQAVV